MSKIKILHIDVETSPMEGYFFDCYRPINYDWIKRDSNILCFCYKWHNEGKVHSIAVDPNRPFDDRALLKEATKVMEEADFVVGHYAARFDWRVIQGRLFLNKLPKLPITKIIDTHTISKKHFKFPSYRLDYLSKRRTGEGKIKVPGQLWLDCCNKVPGALDKMIKYCKQDVYVLEVYYNELRPYDTSINYNTGEGECPHCGEKGKLVKNGTYSQKYQRYKCRACGGSSTGMIRDKTKLIPR